MNHKAFSLSFSLNRPPHWTCPTCGKGVLSIKKESFFKEERRNSRNHSHDDWDPEWIDYVYSCLLVCTNDQCKEVVASAGVGSVDWEDNDDFFRPKFFEPHLLLFNIPCKCPESVSAPLRESFRLFFSGPRAAANNVRIAIEELLTELKVKRFDIVKHKRKFINLDRRINLLPAKYAQVKDHILAIKWLGNAGSHGHANGKGAISMDDVIVSYELTEHILNEIYAHKTQRLDALAKMVNQKKGPVK